MENDQPGNKRRRTGPAAGANAGGGAGAMPRGGGLVGGVSVATVLERRLRRMNDEYARRRAAGDVEGMSLLKRRVAVLSPLWLRLREGGAA